MRRDNDEIPSAEFNAVALAGTVAASGLTVLWNDANGSLDLHGRIRLAQGLVVFIALSLALVCVGFYLAFCVMASGLHPEMRVLGVSAWGLDAIGLATGVVAAGRIGLVLTLVYFAVVISIPSATVVICKFKGQHGRPRATDGTTGRADPAVPVASAEPLGPPAPGV